MKISRRRAWVALLLVALAPRGAQAVDFTRDVRPILSGRCFKCHGPDDAAREANLRLDQREAALAEADSGLAAIVPGIPEESELVRRILAEDEGERMPPPSAPHPLTDAEKDILTRWVAEGAEYRQHWAFIPPVQSPLPAVKQADWPRNPIDHFVLARLEAAGLAPAPEADRHALVRRLYLDLVGLVPTPEEARSFVDDASPDAYERLVERLLASPHYGERWARRWLDLARYADTNGYEKDRPRSIWLYREWVIEALNRDLPFDQFTREQIAGDLLPGAGDEQRIATGFHRNTMLNEEGGIDPLEFRFHAMTDRVATTGTVWLGLTIGCAQCHTHKYDPISHSEYYRLMALLNNADEPTFEVAQPEIESRRAAGEQEIAAAVSELPNHFPADEPAPFAAPQVVEFNAASGAAGEIREDRSVLVSGDVPETDDYTLVVESGPGRATALQLEALADPALPSKGPGRTAHGNFVLTELAVTAAPLDKPADAQPVRLKSAVANFSQDGFPPEKVFDGDAKTGWAIDGGDKAGADYQATFELEAPIGFPAGTRWTIKLAQDYGGQHVLGRLRVRLQPEVVDPRPEPDRRREHLERKLAAWLAEQGQRAVRWTMLEPASAKANVAFLEKLPDKSVLASGDSTKRDVYDVTLAAPAGKVTALRLEALPHPSLPQQGPGRVSYEGPFGDFFLSELTIAAGGKPVKIANASHSYASGDASAARIIDGDPQTGWSINGGQGKPHAVVFTLAEPLENAGELTVQIICERYYAAALGRFRLSTTDAVGPLAASALPAEVDELLLVPAAERTPAQHDQLLAHYLSVAAELAGEHQRIDALRQKLPARPTTLVFKERPAGFDRPTFRHHRGEYLQPKERVEPGVPGVLPKLPPGAHGDRLALANWLVDPANPLVGRVMMNRHWATLFGVGLVRTQEDFGLQGEAPSHPELLDWLAVEFIKQGWSVKQMHRLIVTSATYRQSSVATPEKLERDPQNRLLSRGPRQRLEGELVRDALLSASGLLSRKIGGPSVFPPQPAGVSSEGAYGPLEWKVSEGEDRYRRGLYTFAKRTAPYAMFNTFDAPSGEACVARREVSNTPLQSLTLLNDAALVEAAQALGRATAGGAGTPQERAAALFERCLTRPPSGDELALLVAYHDAQAKRLAAGELQADTIAGPGEGAAAERAAWTLVARAILNLDEMITKQ
ncbi:MAG: PSD1 and planctomycete cytochrome C domain-containing protein [Pirellulales bacterium]